MKSNKKNTAVLHAKKTAITFLILGIVAGCAKPPASNPLGNMPPVNGGNVITQESFTPGYDSTNTDYDYDSQFPDIPDIDEEQAEQILVQEMKNKKEDDYNTNNILSAPNYNPVVTREFSPGVKQFNLQLKRNPGFIKKIFEPSGLTFDDKGNLFTIADKSLSVFKLTPSGTDYSADSAPSISKIQLLKLRLKKRNHFDFEGIVYHNGLFYVIDERDRKVFTIDIKGNINELPIDIDGYLKANSLINNKSNSGPEGIAIDPVRNHLYIVKERQENVVLVADLNTRSIIRHFKVSLPGEVEPSLTDAAYFEGSLYLLVRSHRMILKMNPENGQLVSVYDYRRYEEDPNNVYVKIPTFGSGNDPQGYGVMEGLAVTKDSFYIVTDNNMIPLKKNLFKNHPQLFVFNRPE